MGMRVGHTVEVSTAENWLPDVCHLGDGCFLADKVCLGAAVCYGGVVKVGYTTIEARTFIGNSALIETNSHLPSNCLIGVISTVPASLDVEKAIKTKNTKKKDRTSVKIKPKPDTELLPRVTIPEGTSWLGSPAMNLPARASATTKFKESQTFNPSLKRYIQRYFIEAFRVTGPATVEWISIGAMYTIVIEIPLPWWALCLLWPALNLVRNCVICCFVCAAKWVLIGRYIAQEQPLWSVYVWKSEVC